MHEYLKEHDSKYIYGFDADLRDVWRTSWHLMTPHDSPEAKSRVQIFPPFLWTFVVKVPLPT